MRALPLYSGNREPSVEEMLEDPIVGLVMKRDSVTPDEVRGVMAAAGWRSGCAQRAGLDTFMGLCQTEDA